MPKNKFPSDCVMPFVVLGDPNYETSLEIIINLIDSGAKALELGFPFSDPIADGPVIQRANLRALKNGMTTEKAFNLVQQIREHSPLPISLMLNFNIVLQYGVDNFYSKCKELKMNAVLCPDLPLEESKEVIPYAKHHGVGQVFLIAETTSNDRMEKYARITSGYCYLVYRLGPTGSQDELAGKTEELVSRVRQFFDIPTYLGFGISKPEHVKEALSKGADGVIIGSHLIEVIEKNLDKNPQEKIALEYKKFVAKQ